MARTEFLVSVDILPILATLAGKNFGELSPWAKYKRLEKIEKDQWELLKTSGLCDQTEKLNEQVDFTIKKLSNPGRMVNLSLLSGDTTVEHLIYFCGDNSEAISLASKGESLLFRNPAPIDAIITSFGQYIGYSGLVSSKLDLLLSFKESLVFAALVDLFRRRVLTAFSNMTEPEKGGFSKEVILNAVNETPTNGQWLVSVFKTFTECDNLTLKEVENGLAALEKLKLIARDEGNYNLAGDGFYFSDGFLLISQILRMDVFLNKDGAVTKSSMLCLQAGLHDILYMETEGGHLRLRAVSSKHAVDTMGVLLAEGEESNDTLLKT